MNTLLLKALPYKVADRLVYVSKYWHHEPVVPGPPGPDFANWRADSKLLEGIAAYSGVSESLNLTGVGKPERIQRTLVTASLLDLIGTRLALGRNFRGEGGPAQQSTGGNSQLLTAGGFLGAALGGGKRRPVEEIPSRKSTTGRYRARGRCCDVVHGGC